MRYPSDWQDEYAKQGLCGVLAVAMTGGTTISGAHKVLSQNMMPHQKRHVKSTYPEQIVASLRALGKKVYTYEVERITIRRWIERYAQPGVTYLILTAGHALTLRDGVVCDQGGIAPFMEHRSKRQFVKQILEVM